MFGGSFMGGLNNMRHLIHYIAVIVFSMLALIPWSLAPTASVEAAKAHSKPHVSVASAAASGVQWNQTPVTWDGYTITAAWEGPTSLPTGIPATFQVTVLDNGQPDTNWLYAGVPTAGDALLIGSPVHGDVPDAEGQLPATMTSWNPGTFRPRITLVLGPGQSGSLELPPITFSGPSLTAVPGDPSGPSVSPWWIDQAWDAWPVIEAASHAPTIALLTNGYPATSSINAWLTANGYPPLNVTVAPGLALPSDATIAGNQELMVDLLALGVSAPGATVTLYPFDTNFDQALMSALADASASVLSISYVVPNDQWTPAQQAEITSQWNQAVDTANARGMTVFAAAGDQGPYPTVAGVPPADPSTSVLASLPGVTAVGGVDWRATPDGSDFAAAYWGGTTYANLAEGTLEEWVSAANDQGNMLGGGGYSGNVPEPAWQEALLGAEPGRGVPDLSGPASQNYPGWSPLVGGSPATTGGTSLATPLLAGWVAECGEVVGHGLGNINPQLYQMAQNDPGIFVQPVDGNNGVNQVSQGTLWNPLTGLGAPRVAEMCKALIGESLPTEPAPAVHVTSEAVNGHWLVCAEGHAGTTPLANIPASLAVIPATSVSLVWDPAASPGIANVPGIAATTNDDGTACWGISVPPASRVQVSMAGVASAPLKLARPS